MTLLRRQKLVVVPLLVLVIAGLAWAYRSGPPVFQATASMALVTPSGQVPADENVDPATAGLTTTTTEDPGNPLLRWKDRSILQDVLVQTLSSRPVRADLRRRGLRGSFDLGRSEVFYYRGPIIDITTRAPDAKAAIHDADLLLDETRRQLDQMQTETGVPAQDRIDAIPIVEPTTAVTLYASRTRRMATGMVLGLGLVLAVAATAEGIARHRRRAAGTERPVIGTRVGAT